MHVARFPRPVSEVSLRPRVIVANRTEGGVLFWTGKLYGYAFLSIGFLVVLTAMIAGPFGVVALCAKASRKAFAAQ